MRSLPRARGAGLLEFASVTAGLAGLTVALTYPLAFRLASHGYRLHTVGDHQFSVWNVAWVAHALLTDPLNVFNANIFYPHRGTLLYSEANLAAGFLGVPVYWLTGNAFATHNFVVLLSFVLAGTGAYYLVRYLTRDWRAAAISAVSFAFCPYVFGHLPHIQLLMTAGIPFGLLAFHRMTDQPTVGRGAALGAAMGAQALACAYYAVFMALLIGTAILTASIGRRAWREPRYWKAAASAAVVALAIIVPLFLPYLLLERGSGFGRTLEESRVYSATWSDYITASAYAASWLLPSKWVDVLFPGFLVASASLVGLYHGWRSPGRDRQVMLLYAGIAIFACWFSLGPAGGLYSLAYGLIPGFSFLRAPSRFGILVTLALCVLQGIGISAMLERTSRPLILAAVLVTLAAAERVAPLAITPNPPIQPVYYALARQEQGALIELPPLSRGFTRTPYMLASTVHWMPLVNAYTDFIPESFTRNLPTLAEFPSRESIAMLRQDKVRYAIFHLEEYRKNGVLTQLEDRLAEFAPHLKLLYEDTRAKLYEIVQR